LHKHHGVCRQIIVSTLVRYLMPNNHRFSRLDITQLVSDGSRQTNGRTDT